MDVVYIQREEELVSAWWKEYAEVSAGPTNALSYNLQTEKELAEKLRSLSSASDRVQSDLQQDSADTRLKHSQPPRVDRINKSSPLS